MSDHKWRTTAEIAAVTQDPATSIQAQLRHLRKERFGAYLVECRRRNEKGRWEYRVGEKGEGTPKHSRCTNCEVLEAEIVRLEGLLTNRIDVNRIYYREGVL
jgi:hypothetical protein